MKNVKEITPTVTRWLEKFNSDEILSVLIKASEGTMDEDYLINVMIDHLKLNGYNLIKAETMVQQMQIEQSFMAIVPYMSNQETQCELAYC